MAALSLTACSDGGTKPARPDSRCPGRGGRRRVTVKIPGMGVSDPDRRIAPIADKQSDRGGRMHTVLTISLGGHQNVRGDA